jgi:ABC-type amino acid transport substrate-binding protein
VIFGFTFPYLVTVLKGGNTEEYLLRAELGAKIISLDSFKTAIRGLSEGKYDAVVIQELPSL